MTLHSEPHRPRDDAIAAIEAQISFVLDHPGMTSWLKGALRGALSVDPLQVLNDLEILNQILRKRSAVLLSGRQV